MRADTPASNPRPGAGRPIRRFDGVVLLSGGLDSTVVAHRAAAQGQRLRALYLDLGTHPTLQELDSARRTAHRLGIPLDVVDVSGLLKAFIGYIPLGEVFSDELDIHGETPYMFVSFAIPMAIASYFAQAVECAELHVGAVGEQASGRKDLPGFFEAWPGTLSLLADPSAPELVVRAPFLDGPKSAVVRAGEELGVDLQRTWSCHRGGDEHDGVCSGCRARRRAFSEAGVEDRTVYAR
jgi:7-cyano-7-deazaguanine synthase